MARTRSPSATAPSPRTLPRAATTIAAPAAWRALSAPGPAPASQTTREEPSASAAASWTINQASGGHDNTAGGTGTVFAGFGAGGGIFNYLGNYNSAGYGQSTPSVVTVTTSLIDLNQAEGGGGGDGEGGGIYVGSGGSATIDQTLITLNLAAGGLCGWSGSGGQGLGGGLYVAAGGSATLTSSLVIGNFASTKNDNIYGVVSFT